MYHSFIKGRIWIIPNVRDISTTFVVQTKYQQNFRRIMLYESFKQRSQYKTKLITYKQTRRNIECEPFKYRVFSLLKMAFQRYVCHSSSAYVSALVNICSFIYTMAQIVTVDAQLFIGYYWHVWPAWHN